MTSPSRASVVQGLFGGSVAQAKLIKAREAIKSAAIIQRKPGVDAFPVNLRQSSGGWPLPRDVQGKMEAALGADFSDVRIHVGAEASAIGAIAFTWGSDIHFAPGQYNPHTPHGQVLLGHELAHVIQQRAGRVTNPFGSGVAVVQDHALEAEADRLGHKAAMSRAPEAASSPVQASRASVVPPLHQQHLLQSRLPHSARATAYAPTPRLAAPAMARLQARMLLQRQTACVAHAKGCCCGRCSPRPVRPAPPVLRYRSIQRCVYCNDNSCIKGEKCGYDRSLGGFFSPALSSSTVGVLPYNSSNAKKQSGKALGTELEHVIPGAALRQSGQGGNYRYEYTVPLDTDVHRGGVQGGGGGISSTGSSSTAKGWATHLAQQPSSFEQVKAALVDGINALLMNGKLDEAAVIKYSDWLQAQYSQEQRISEYELFVLRSLLVKRFENQL